VSVDIRDGSIANVECVCSRNIDCNSPNLRCHQTISCKFVSKKSRIPLVQMWEFF